MRIIITGASGNIGSALLRRLTSDDHEIVGMARRTPDDSGPFGGVGWVGVDLTRNEQAIIIALGSKLTSEAWLLDAHNPAGEPVVTLDRPEWATLSARRVLPLPDA